MLDLNNPYLSAQEKNDILALEVSAEYREEKRLMADAGMPFSSPSYWVLTFREFYELASTSSKLNTLFSGRFEDPDCWFPESEVVLMEHDRVEAGEWDNFHKRFNPLGYQKVAVIGLNGLLAGEIPKFFEEKDGKLKVACFKWEVMKEVLEKYEASAHLCKNEIPLSGIDLWDIPISELNEYENKRVYKRTYIFSSMFSNLLEKEMSAIEAAYLRHKMKLSQKVANKIQGFRGVSKKSTRKKK